MKKLLHLGMVAMLFFSSQFLSAQCATDLIISEYVEGSSNNKFIEIYNGTSSPVALGTYALEIYFNGNTSAGSTISLSGTLAVGAVYVVANSSYSTSLYTGSVDQTSSGLSFNGNDAVVLTNSGTQVDVLGTIGGSATYAQNTTLRRQATITAPVTTYDAGEWDVFGQDVVSGLGSHTMNCSSTPCVAPSSDAIVGLVPGISTIDVSISAPSSGADAYLTILKTTNSIATPTNGSNYTVGSTFDNGTVVGNGINTTINLTGLNAGTTYYVFVFAYNASSCIGGPEYAASVSQSATTTGNPTTLLPGDMVIVGFDTYTTTGGPDQVVMTNLKAIGQGTKFILSNAVYEFKAAAGERTNRWYNGNGNFGFDVPILEITYIGTGLPAGTVICLDLSQPGSLAGVTIGGVDVTSDFAETNPGVGKFVQLSSSSADALFIMQGDFTNGLVDGDGDLYGVLEAGGRVLGGLQTAGNFQDFALAGDAGGSRVSRIHPDIECFGISTGGTPGGFFGYYDVLSNITTGSQHDLLKAIVDFSVTWITGTTAGVSATPPDTNDISRVICDPVLSFTVLSAAEAGNWVGDTNEDWFNCLNWDNLQVPDTATDVTIGPSAQDNCEVDISVFSTNAAKFDNIATCNNLSLSNGSFRLEISSASEDTLLVNGNVNILEGPSAVADDGGILDMTDGANGGTLIVKGDWFDLNLPRNRFEEGIGSKVLFNGTTQQSINVQATNIDPNEGEEFANFEVDNPNGLLLAGRVEVTRQMTFNNGIISSQTGTPSGTDIKTAANIMVFGEATTVSGTSDASHVDGIVSKFGSSDFTYPVGDGSFYRPATLIGSVGAIASDEFRVEFFSDNPSIAYTASNMSGVTNAEFWNIDRTNGTASKAVELSWDQTKTSNVTDPSVVRLDTSSNPTTDFWELAGGNGKAATSGPGASGSVASALVNTFSPFTLTDADPFPIELIYFKGKRQDQQVLLSWETSLEINNSHFVLERSADNRSFHSLANVPASGSRKGAYQWLDQKPLIGKNYYRLVQVDFDGTESTSHTVEVNMLAENQAGLWAVYPNPVQNELNFDFQLTESANVQIRLFNLQGQLVKQSNRLFNQGQHSHKLNVAGLSSGIYHFEILAQGQRIRGKFQKK